MTKRTDGPSAAVRIRVMKRDRFRCTYCGTAGTDVELEVDHIIPVAKGGSHHMSNLTTACRACNQSKGDRDAPKKSGDTKWPTHSQGLVGLFVLTFKDGRMQYQGRVIGMDGETCLVQLFSWMMGEPTDVVPYDKATLYGPTVRLFADPDSWRGTIENLDRAERARS